MIKNIFTVAPTLVKLLGSMAHNVSGIAEGTALKNVCLKLVQKLIELQMLNFALLPCFWQYHVMGWAVLLS
jgi:hypothetical protein